MKELPASPVRGRMRCNIEVNDAAPLMGKNEEDIENVEEDCRNGEEINRGKLLGVVFQKCAPCLRGRFGMPDHFNNDKGRTLLRSITKEPNPKESVPRPKYWATSGTLQDDDLASQSEDFGLERETRFQAGEEG